MTERLPLFPLHTVLFPDGLLPLRVFEARYMDMVSRCLREGGAFGVCLIAQGPEVGEAAVPCPVGTEALIETADMDQPGLLHILVRGRRRFRLVDHEVERDGLLTGVVVWLDEPAPAAVPPARTGLLPLLQALAEELGERMPRPLRLDDAGWVGARYAELLPIPPAARQRLLELDDPLGRLEIIHRYLDQHGLLPR